MMTDWRLMAVVIGVYFMALMVVAGLARRAQQNNSAEDFYLGNRSFGAVALFFTLFATQ